MFHALYLIAFLGLTTLALTNLVRNLMLLGRDSRSDRPRGTTARCPIPSHPEMLDESGQVTQEPLLVMRSISLQDARQRLEALYDPSSRERDDLGEPEE